MWLGALIAETHKTYFWRADSFFQHKMSAFPAGLCFMDDFLLPNATGSRREVFLSPYDPYSGWLSQYFMGKTSPQEPFSFQVAFLLFAQAGRLEHLQSPTAKLGVLEVAEHGL